MLHRFERRHAQRFQRLEPRFQHRILVHAVGMKLLEDPFLQADLLYAFDVAGPGAKGEAIQRVQDLVVLRELLLEQLVIVCRLGFFGFRGGREGQKDAAEHRGQESTAGFHEPTNH